MNPLHEGKFMPLLSESDISRIVEMAWEDRTAFEAIEVQFGLNESAVVVLMRRQMKLSSFRMWRKRMAGRVTKHAALHTHDQGISSCAPPSGRAHCCSSPV